MVKLFGTDGIRGKANSFPLTADHILRMGQVFGQELGKKHKNIAIGRDTRISGDMIEAALTAGITSVGVNVVSLGVLPTPTICNFAPMLDIDAIIILTASHNPYYDNGIKLRNPHGHAFPVAVETELENIILSDKKIEVDIKNIGQTSENKEIFDKYIKSFDSFSSLKGLKIVMDSANGAFSEISKIVLKNLGADVVSIFDNPNGYNINEACGATNTKALVAKVLSEKADIGISVDGDGDRVMVVTDKGEEVNGDQFLAFLMRDYMAKGKLKGNAIVTNELSNMGIAKFCKENNVNYQYTPVGEPLVVAKMNELGCNLGGEGTSGHMMLFDHSICGDGLIAGIEFASAVLSSGKKASESFPVFEEIPMTTNNIRFENKEQVVELVDCEEMQKLIADCRKELGENSSLIVRKSGTEPVVRLYVQCGDLETLERVTSKLKDKLEKGK